jgi:hypothetical protein
MLSALIIHSFNLKSGLKCTGFDEDDPETTENILNIPSNFVQNSTELMTFRYTFEGKEGDIILKIIPQNLDAGDRAYLDINAMNSKSEDEIFSCEVKFNDIDLVSADKSKLGNLDSWVVEGDKGYACLVTK